MMFILGILTCCEQLCARGVYVHNKVTTQDLDMKMTTYGHFRADKYNYFVVIKYLFANKYFGI